MDLSTQLIPQYFIDSDKTINNTDDVVLINSLKVWHQNWQKKINEHETTKEGTEDDYGDRNPSSIFHRAAEEKELMDKLISFY